MSKKKRPHPEVPKGTPSKDLRTIWVVIEPGEDVIVSYDTRAFAFWEVESALARALEKINEEESERQLESLQQFMTRDIDDDDDI